MIVFFKATVNIFIVYRLDIFSDLGAGDDLHGAAAEPGPQADLDVLAAPDLQPGVIAAQLSEPGAVYREQAAWKVGAVLGIVSIIVFLNLRWLVS